MIIKRLKLVKEAGICGGPPRERETFIIDYEVGQEAATLEYLIDLVNRRETSFDWYDCAQLSHKLGQEMAEEARRQMWKKKAA